MACKYILDGKEYTEQEFNALAERQFMNRPKTRRVLEIQSDLFQKGRDHKELVKRTADYNLLTEEEEAERDELIRKHNQPESDEDVATFSQERLNELNNKLTSNKEEVNGSKNQFLQLLNKEGNWIPFFIKSIVQDSAKKGYEKVLFPTGDTASKVEGHETLENFYNDKKNRIAHLEESVDRINGYGIKDTKLGYILESEDGYTPMAKDKLGGSYKTKSEARDAMEKAKYPYEVEIKQLKEELKRVESEGFAALKPIYDFYENRVKNTLNKIYGKDKVERIKDEYGNEWYQVDIDRERELSPIFFQLSPNEAVDRIIKGFKSLRPKFFERKFVGYSTGTTASKMAAEINRWIKDKEAFSGIKAISIGAYNTIAFQDINTGKLYQLSSQSTEAADEGLDAIMKGYIGSLGGKVNQGKEIVVDGKVIPVNAVTNVVARTVDYVQDKARIDTLPEETAHIWFHWLPLNSVLRRDMMKDIRTRPIYDQVMEEYSGNSYYQNSDGTVNEEKIAIEAIGKLIAGAIVGEYKKDKKVQSLLQRLIDFIKGLFKGFDGYKEAAQQILQGDTSSIEVGDIKLTTKNRIENDIQSIINTAVAGRFPDSTFQTAFSLIRGSQGVSETGQGKGSEIPQWADYQREGLEYKGKLGELLDEGGEHIAYLNEEDKKIIKVAYDLDNNRGLELYLKDMLIHNYLFPLTAYKLLGFVNRNGKICPVVEQNFVTSNTEYNSSTVENILRELGFIKYSDTEYRSDNITISDLFPRNVFFVDGIPQFIDPAIMVSNQFYRKLSQSTPAQEANQRGEYYFQLSEDEEKMAKAQMRNATPVQKKIIQEVYLDVHNRVVLDPVTHTYTNLNIENPVTYTSVTTAIHGKKDFGVDEHGVPMYEANRLWGNDFDGIMSDVIQGKKVIRDTPNISPEVRGEVIGYIRAMIDKFTADGSIALTQVIVTDEQAHIAGSIDLLLIDPLGNMRIVDLKTSWSTTKGNAFRNTKYSTGEGSLIKEPISKRTGYSVQVGSYAKMINLMGYPVAETRSEHILLQHADDKVTGFTYEGAQIYLPSENEKLVDAIVPTVYEGKDRLAELNNEFGTGNPTHKEDFDSNAPESEAKKMEYAEAQAMLAAATLKGWKEYMKDLKHETAFSISNSSIMRIDALLNAMQQELDEGRGYSGVYTVFLHKINDHLASILHYLNSPENVKSPAYIRTALLAKEYISRFKDLAYVEKFGDAFQIGLSNRVLQNIRNVDVAIVQAIENHVKELVATWTTNPAYKDSKVLEEAVTGIQKDITNATLYLDTIGNSGNVILENLSKLLATKREEIRDMVEQNDATIDTAANNLADTMGTHDSKKLYDIFHQKDSKGKRTGQLIGQKGQYYKELAAKVNGDLEFYDEGTHSWRRKEYIKNAVSKEDIQWNKDLYYLKERQRLFNSAEKTAGDYNTGSVSSEDGDYHMLSDSFKAERAQYMYQDSTKSGMWVAKNENDPIYQEWRDRNMTWVEWTGAITKWNKKTKTFEPTGQTEDRSGWFPNKEHVTSREISSKETGSKDLWDKDFRKIMTGTSPVEKAQRAYYIAYKDMMRKLVEGLPAGAMQWFDQGYIPTIRANFVQQLADKDINTAELITSELKNFFEMTATYDDSSVAKTGVTQSLPIMYMGTLQSQKRMKEVQDMLAAHSAKKLTATNQQEWLKEHRALTELLKKESARVTAEQLHPDLTIGLKAMNQMATNFHIMSGVEDSLQAVKSHLLEQKFNDKGKLIDGGASTRTLQLLNHVMDVCFYNDPAFTKTTMERMTGKLMQLTSTLSIPLNLFGMVNNKLMARLNNRIDSIGGDFFSKKAYRRAQIRYNTEHVPGYVRTRMQFMNDKGYGEKRPGSKYEALTHKFNMVRHLKTNDGRVDFIAKIGGYAGYEAGEWEVQSLVGNSIIDTVQMKYTGTDPNLQDCSVYDAHTFDSNTGKLELIPGYVYTDKEGNVVDDQKKAQYLIVNRIHETNDRIHGNYDPANKVFLERTAVGKMLLQFKKWVYPALKQRYKSRKWDENLGGGMDIEGRYTTLWEFLKAFKELGALTDRWAELTPHQQSNLKKDLADAIYIASLFCLYIIVKRLGEGLGDDDPYTKKMKNWLLYQSNRGMQEVSIFVPAIGALSAYQLTSNPFAATSSIRSFAILVHDMTAWPVRSEEERVYQRGNYKGMSKIGVDALRVLPGGGTVRTLQNLNTIENFYISGK